MIVSCWIIRRSRHLCRSCRPQKSSVAVMRKTDERDSDKIAAALSETSEWHRTGASAVMSWLMMGPAEQQLPRGLGSHGRCASGRGREGPLSPSRGQQHLHFIRSRICNLSCLHQPSRAVRTQRHLQQENFGCAFRISYFSIICHETMQSTNPRANSFSYTLYCALLEMI